MAGSGFERSIVLASSSPRRRELMALSGIPFEAFAADADEDCQGPPQERVMTIAQRKALAAALHFPDRLILAADTLVYADGQVLGKPSSAGEARRMLKLLSGRAHQVYTGVCLMPGSAKQADTRFDQTDVIFSALLDEDIEGYVLSGEPMDKAGAYALQGMGGMFVEGIRGSYSNVIGLPMALVKKMLLDNGFKIF